MNSASTIGERAAHYHRTIEYQTAGEKEYLDWLADKLPMRDLPADCALTETTKLPRKLIYGVPITTSRMLAYATAHGLVLKKDPAAAVTKGDCDEPVLTRLWDLTGCRHLDIGYPVARLVETVLIMLYSNHDVGRRRRLFKEKERTIAIIREKLGIEEEAMWYWDMGDARNM